MNGTLNASISSTNAAYTRIKALEKELEALKSEVNVDTSKITKVQSELDSYKTAMSSQVTADNVTAASSLTSNGSTHVNTLTADKKITANQGIDSSGAITVTDQYSKTSSIDGASVNTSVVNATIMNATGTVKSGYLNVGHVATVEDLTVQNSGNIINLTSNDIHAYEDVTVDGDLSFPKVNSNINGEYLTVNAQNINASGDLQVKGQTVVDGSLVVKDTIAAKNIIGDLDLNDLKVQSATVTDLITKTAVSSTSAVGFDSTGKLVPIKASGGGGGTSDVAQAVETEKTMADLRTSSDVANISSSEYVLYAVKADDDTYRLMTFDDTNVYAKLYHYSTGSLETLSKIATLLNSASFPVAALIDDKLYFVDSADQKSIKCFDYTSKTTTTTYSSTDYKIYAFNTMLPYSIDFAGIPFALLYDDESTEGHAIKRVVKFDGTIVAEDSEYIKKGIYNDILIPYDLNSVIYFVTVTESKKAYYMDPETMLFTFSDGENVVSISEENVTPVVVKQNNMGLFDTPVDGVATVYWVSENSAYVFNEETQKAVLVDCIKIRTDNVSLNINKTESAVTFIDTSGKQLAQLEPSILTFFAGFDTSYNGIYGNYICPKYSSKQNVLINSQQAALDSLDSFSVDNTPVYIDGRQFIDGRAYDYVLSSQLELESLLKQLYEEGVQTDSTKYKDLNVYLKDAVYLLRNSILGTLRANKSLYGLHFYGESKNATIQAVGFDIPGTPVEGEIKYYKLTTTYPMFERSCSFENLSIQILTGQLSTTSDFTGCDITATCSGWILPFYGYNFDRCKLVASGTLKAPPEAFTNIVYSATIYNDITCSNLAVSDTTLISLIKAQHVRDCTIDISSLVLANQVDSTTSDFYLMMPFSTPSDASFERNTFTDIKSSSSTVTLYPLPNMYGYGSKSGIAGCYSWHGFKGNIFSGISKSTKVLQLTLGAIDRIKVSNSAGTYSKYLYRAANDIPGEYDLMTNNFIAITDRG